MKNDILVVGGYGEVGQYVVLELLKYYPEHIIIAGRNLKQALSFAATTGYSLKTMELDIYDIGKLDKKLESVNVVIMCLNPKNTVFAEYCIMNNINYIDISPSNQVASEIEKFKENALKNNITCILGVGLAPGLSTLLAKNICNEFDEKKQINLTLMLGLGENHGKDGIKWMLDNLANDFILMQNEEKSIVKPFVNGINVDFPLPIGRRKAYRFNLADQQILTNQLKINNVSCYFCYNSKLITFLVHFLKIIGIFKLLKYQKFYNIILNIFSFTLKIIKPLYSDTYAVHISVAGIKKESQVVCNGTIIGNNNPVTTGKLAAYIAKMIYDGLIKLGVYYLGELLDLNNIMEQHKDDFDFSIQYKK